MAKLVAVINGHGRVAHRNFDAFEASLFCVYVYTQLCDKDTSWQDQSLRFLIFLNEFSDSSPIYRWNSVDRKFVLLQALTTNRATSAVFFLPQPPLNLCQKDFNPNVLYLAIAQVSCMDVFLGMNAYILLVHSLPLP